MSWWQWGICGLWVIGFVLMLTGHTRNVDGSARLMFGYRLLAFFFMVIGVYTAITEISLWILVYSVLFIYYAINEYRARIIFNHLFEVEFKNEEK